MKKIVIVTDAWHPQVNGVVRTLTKCHDLMIERGYDVTVVSPLDYRSVPCPTYPEIRLALTTPGALKRRLKPCSRISCILRLKARLDLWLDVPV